jgi:hypothetical protein
MLAAPHVLSLLSVRKSGWCRLQYVELAHKRQKGRTCSRPRVGCFTCTHAASSFSRVEACKHSTIMVLCSSKRSYMCRHIWATPPHCCRNPLSPTPAACQAAVTNSSCLPNCVQDAPTLYCQLVVDHCKPTAARAGCTNMKPKCVHKP